MFLGVPATSGEYMVGTPIGVEEMTTVAREPVRLRWDPKALSMMGGVRLDALVNFTACVNVCLNDMAKQLDVCEARDSKHAHKVMDITVQLDEHRLQCDSQLFRLAAQLEEQRHEVIAERRGERLELVEKRGDSSESELDMQSRTEEEEEEPQVQDSGARVEDTQRAESDIEEVCDHHCGSSFGVSVEAPTNVETYMAEVRMQMDVYWRRPEARQTLDRMAEGMVDIICRHMPHGSALQPPWRTSFLCFVFPSHRSAPLALDARGRQNSNSRVLGAGRCGTLFYTQNNLLEALRKLMNWYDPRTALTQRSDLKAITPNTPAKRIEELEANLLKLASHIEPYESLGGRPLGERSVTS